MRQRSITRGKNQGTRIFLKKLEFDSPARRKLYCAKSCGAHAGVASGWRKPKTKSRKTQAAISLD